jgi:hypothetical protein
VSSAEKRVVLVEARTRIAHAGVLYLPGQVFSLAVEEAQALLDVQAAVPAGEAHPPAGVLDRLVSSVDRAPGTEKALGAIFGINDPPAPPLAPRRRRSG